MLVRVKSVLGENSTTAALSELGIRTQRKNGSVASTAYDMNNPATWSGVSWTETQPFQITGIDWSNKTLMRGNFDADLFANLGDNYNFTNTQINVVTSLKEVELDKDVKVSPTIVENHLFVSTNNEIKSITAVNMLGVQIPIKHKEGQADVSKLSKGNYILLIMTDKGKAISKFVKK